MQHHDEYNQVILQKLLQCVVPNYHVSDGNALQAAADSALSKKAIPVEYCLVQEGFVVQADVNEAVCGSARPPGPNDVTWVGFSYESPIT